MSEETIVEETLEQKELRFHLYKTKSSLHVDTWLKTGKIMLKFAPGIEGKTTKGQPEKGSTQYDYTKAITIGFSYMDLLKASYKLIALSYGEDVKYEKFADLSKIDGKDLKGQKKLSFTAASYKDKKGQDVHIVSGQISFDVPGQDKQNISISLDLDEAYVLAKHFEYTYQFCLGKSLEFEINRKKDNGDK